MRQIDLKYFVETSPSTMYNFVGYYYFSWTSVFFSRTSVVFLLFVDFSFIGTMDIFYFNNYIS